MREKYPLKGRNGRPERRPVDSRLQREHSGFRRTSGEELMGCDNSSQRVNFSYHPSTVTTTVHYNNHCTHAVRAAAEILDHHGSVSHDCFSVPAEKQSSIKFQQGLSGTFIGIDKC
ncbi:hypothetical protein [Streptomyces antibioticus]|uniref:hypothetical protein n=1 Tax=Streptomyces antibioticus TaxID=1890 RepID=UPI003F44D69B